MAAKVVDLSRCPSAKERAKMVKVFNEELAVLVQLRSPRIIQMYGAVYDEDVLMLVMDLANSGNLREFLDGNPDAQPNMRLTLLLDVAVGMEYLHKKQVL